MADATVFKQALSLDGKRFIIAAQQHGFRFLKVDHLGVAMESARRKLIFTVFASHHPTNIHTLVYCGNGPNEESTSIVLEGRRNY